MQTISAAAIAVLVTAMLYLSNAGQAHAEACSFGMALTRDLSGG